MAIPSGTRLGPYEVLSTLGAGAMGEVYRARDTRLDRLVAVKVLNDQLAAEPGFRRRFAREAKAISALNHPHICTLYDVGTHEGLEFLVMELVEGETLATRLQRGPLPVGQVVSLGTEIASALERAHKNGVVHRDLKPGNIMLTKGGVKLLDFGLALLTSRGGAEAASPLDPTVVKADAETMTREGILVGTIPYLAPELLNGSRADARSDLFAFGCVLFEMATGNKAFAGDKKASIFSAIVSHEPPPLSSVQPEVPPGLENLVRSCLAKDPDERWQNAHDAVVELRWIASGRAPLRPGSPHAAVSPGTVAALERRRLVVAGWTLGALVLALLVTAWWPKPAAPPATPMRSALLPPEGATWSGTPLSTSIAVSPNGRQIAFTAGGERPAALWVQSFDEATAHELDGTNGAMAPFWSPDGRRIGFFAKGKLRVVPADGGPALTLGDAPFGHAGSWGARGTILYSRWRGTEAGIYRIAETGGGAVKLALSLEPGQIGAWPEFLPDGKRFLFLSGAFTALFDERHVCVASLEGGKPRCLAPSDTRGVLTPAGFLFSVRHNQLVCQPLDPESLAPRGEVKVLIPRVLTFTPAGTADFSLSESGRVLAARTPPPASHLVWVDRGGQPLGQIGDPGQYAEFRLSPDGTQVAAALEDETTGANDIWLFDTRSGLGTRIIVANKNSASPVWSPDGKRLAYAYAERYRPKIRIHEFGALGADRLLLESDGVLVPGDWSHDGSVLAYEDFSGAGSWLRFVGLRPGAVMPRGGAISGGDNPAFSSDDRLLAYESLESESPQVYVASTGDLAQRVRVSAAGGSQPHWRRDGKELFFLSRDGTMMVAGINSTSPPSLSAPKPLFRTGQADNLRFDVSADGQRFLLLLPVEKSRAAVIQIVSGWQALETMTHQ